MKELLNDAGVRWGAPAGIFTEGRFFDPDKWTKVTDPQCATVSPQITVGSVRCNLQAVAKIVPAGTAGSVPLNERYREIRPDRAPESPTRKTGEPGPERSAGTSGLALRRQYRESVPDHGDEESAVPDGRVQCVEPSSARWSSELPESKSVDQPDPQYGRRGPMGATHVEDRNPRVSRSTPTAVLILPLRKKARREIGGLSYDQISGMLPMLTAKEVSAIWRAR